MELAWELFAERLLSNVGFDLLRVSAEFFPGTDDNGRLTPDLGENPLL